MAEIEIISEREIEQGWRFEVAVYRDGRRTTHQLDLSWPDYDYWCAGAAAPESVAAAVVRFLIEQRPEVALPERFDASTVRRRTPDIDGRIRGLIRE